MFLKLNCIGAQISQIYTIKILDHFDVFLYRFIEKEKMHFFSG